MTPKFGWTRHDTGNQQLELHVEDGDKTTFWTLRRRARPETIAKALREAADALVGPIPPFTVTLPAPSERKPEVIRSIRVDPVSAEYHRQPSEWDGPGEDTVLEYTNDSGKDEPFPVAELLAPVETSKHQMTEAESRAILEATTAMLRRRASWVDDPESINPREVNDIDAGQRPPELHPGMGAPSVRVEGRKLVQ